MGGSPHAPVSSTLPRVEIGLAGGSGLDWSNSTEHQNNNKKNKLMNTGGFDNH